MSKLSRSKAEKLGLKVHPLLSWDLSKACARVMKPDQVYTHLVYGLDNFEYMQLEPIVLDKEVAETIVRKSEPHFPLRPLFLNPVTGMSQRAIPLDWHSGVSYNDYRSTVHKTERR